MTAGSSQVGRTGIARALSKLGYCSRKVGATLVRSGCVTVNGRVIRDPEFAVWLRRDTICVNGQPIRRAALVYFLLNKPRGLVTSAADEQGRPTVFECFRDAPTGFVSPVGRLDKASEGLLLLTNDTGWAAAVTDPQNHIEKTYHVQVNTVADQRLLRLLREGVQTEGEWLKVKRAHILRQGIRNCWLELVLDEGKNRHIRRLLSTFDIDVLRLVRVAIGRLQLGSLAKGQYRPLTKTEVHLVWPKAGGSHQR